MPPRPVSVAFVLLAALGAASPSPAQTAPPADGPLLRALRASPLGVKPAERPTSATAHSERAAGTTTVFAPGAVIARPTSPGPRVLSAPPAPGVDHRKSPVTEGFSGNQFGSAFATLGDLKNDGASDFAVGAWNQLNPSGTGGKVYIYLYTPTGGTSQELESGQAGSAFGFALAGVGDVNGDGFVDLLVGEPSYDLGIHAEAGRASLYLGSAIGFNPAPAWSFTTGEDGATVGFRVAWAGDVNHDGYDDWMVGAPGHSNGESGEGAVYLFFGGSGALSGTPVWTQESDQLGAALGYGLSTAGDVNADGYADLVLGAPGAVNTLTNEGSVSLFMGAPGGPTHVAARTWFGGQLNAQLGLATGAAGDINGDGFSDFIAGAPFYTDGESSEGIAQVYLGAATPLLIDTPTELQADVVNGQFGAAVGTAGDVNGDGYADVIIGAPGLPEAAGVGAAFLYLGSDFGVTSLYWDRIDNVLDNTQLGRCVGTLGDLDGDGRSEWGAGDPGLVGDGYLFLHGGGALTNPYDYFVAQGLVANGQFGLVGTSLDSDGDGYDDLVGGTLAGGSDEAYRGSLALYRGSPHPFPAAGPYPFLGATPDWTYEGATVGDAIGSSVSNAGDVNGDGYEDLVTGGYNYSGGEASEGEALLFYGSSSGLAGAPVWQTEGNQLAALHGYSVAGGGDLNGDGYDDVVVGAPQANLGLDFEGTAAVYLGSALGLAHTPAVTLRGNQANAVFGVSCVIPGDVNNDGYDDLVVGAPYFGDGESQEGRLFLYFGSPTGVHAPAAQEVQINVVDAQLGWSAARIGDINRDGYADLIVGAPGFTDGEAGEGRVLVYLGSVTGFVTPAAWTLDGNEAGASLGYTGLGGAGDFNGDGFGDVIVGWPLLDMGGEDAGRITVFAGKPDGVQALPLSDLVPAFTGIELGTMVGGMADFNGDGATDLYYAAPNFGLYAANEGVAAVRLGNTYGQWNADWPVSAWRTDGSAPIVPGQRSNSTAAFSLRSTARSAAGRTRVKLEWEVKPVNTAFNFAGRGSSGWQNTSGVLPGVGSKTAINSLVSGLGPATRYHWRARYRSASPLFPSTPWFGTERIGPTERMLVTAGGQPPVGVDPGDGVPGALALAAAAPNPFTETAALAFTLPRAGHATLALYDVHGRLVRTLFDGAAAAGRTTRAWDGRDAAGRLAPAGAYFTRLTFAGEERVGKILRLR